MGQYSKDINMKAAVIVLVIIGSCYGSYITELQAKTSTVDHAGCDHCKIYAAVCDSYLNCCDAGYLDTSGDDLESGHIDTFTSIGECKNFSVHESGNMIVTVTHTGSDGWRGVWFRVVLSNGSFKTCPIHQWLDDTQMMELICS